MSLSQYWVFQSDFLGSVEAERKVDGSVKNGNSVAERMRPTNRQSARFGWLEIWPLTRKNSHKMFWMFWNKKNGRKEIADPPTPSLSRGQSPGGSARRVVPRRKMRTLFLAVRTKLNWTWNSFTITWKPCTARSSKFTKKQLLSIVSAMIIMRHQSKEKKNSRPLLKVTRFFWKVKGIERIVQLQFACLNWRLGGESPPFFSSGQKLTPDRQIERRHLGPIRTGLDLPFPSDSTTVKRDKTHNTQ